LGERVGVGPEVQRPVDAVARPVVADRLGGREDVVLVERRGKRGPAVPGSAERHALPDLGWIGVHRVVSGNQLGDVDEVTRGRGLSRARIGHTAILARPGAGLRSGPNPSARRGNIAPRFLFTRLAGSRRSPGGTAIMTAQDTEATEFAAEWEHWHKQHEDRLAAPDGFLAITSINWLTETPTRFADAPGAWAADDSGVSVVLDDGETLELDGAVLRGRHHFGRIPERGGRFRRDASAVYEVARRGGNDILRPRHPDNRLRAEFHGTPAYAPDPRWAVRGRYRPFEAPRDTTVGSVVEGLQHVYAVPGVVEFEVDGQPLALSAFNGTAPGSLHILFTDATSGVTTYPANRSLHVAAPDA